MPMRTRPRLPASERRRELLSVKVTDAEARAIRAAAEAAGKTVSDYMRGLAATVAELEKRVRTAEREAGFAKVKLERLEKASS